MREKIARYSFEVNWVPGKTHYIADALSSAPLFSPQEQPDLEIDTAITCLAATSHPSLSVITRAIDDDYRSLIQDVLSNTTKSTYSRSLKSEMSSFSVSNGLVLLDSTRIVLPIPAVKPVLQLLHTSHSGINKTILLARGLYYWPGLVNDVKQYLLYHELRSLSAESVIRVLTTWFNTLGWPSSIRSDGGPQFCGDFPRFCAKNNIVHELSAPYNPRSNGLAEAGVKSVKNILRKSYDCGADPLHALYEWRNVPRADGYSPAQLMLGRQQRTGLPTIPQQIRPIDFLSPASSKDKAHDISKSYHDRSKLFLPALSPGQHVFLQDPKSSNHRNST